MLIALLTLGQSGTDGVKQLLWLAARANTRRGSTGVAPGFTRFLETGANAVPVPARFKKFVEAYDVKYNPCVSSKLPNFGPKWTGDLCSYVPKGDVEQTYRALVAMVDKMRATYPTFRAHAQMLAAMGMETAGGNRSEISSDSEIELDPPPGFDGGGFGLTQQVGGYGKFPGQDGKCKEHPSRKGWKQCRIGANFWKTIDPSGKEYNWYSPDGGKTWQKKTMAELQNMDTYEAELERQRRAEAGLNIPVSTTMWRQNENGTYDVSFGDGNVENPKICGKFYFGSNNKPTNDEEAKCFGYDNLAAWKRAGEPPVNEQTQTVGNDGKIQEVSPDQQQCEAMNNVAGRFEWRNGKCFNLVKNCHVSLADVDNCESKFEKLGGSGAVGDLVGQGENSVVGGDKPIFSDGREIKNSGLLVDCGSGFSSPTGECQYDPNQSEGACKHFGGNWDGGSCAFL